MRVKRKFSGGGVGGRELAAHVHDVDPQVRAGGQQTRAQLVVVLDHDLHVRRPGRRVRAQAEQQRARVLGAGDAERVGAGEVGVEAGEAEALAPGLGGVFEAEQHASRLVAQAGELAAWEHERLLDLAVLGRLDGTCPQGQVVGRQRVDEVPREAHRGRPVREAQADAILVHHGWFWRGEDGRIAGFRKNRLKSLLAHDINLYGYHLPLDGHAEFGNNAQLAQRMEWIVDGRFGDQDIGWMGRMDKPMTRAELARKLAAELGRAPLVIGDDDPDRPLVRIAWCSGGAQSLFEEAVDQGVDVYLSGEVSEQNVHLARESGVTYIAAGHHATERYGVRALAEHLAERFGLYCEFVDIDSPV